MEARKNNLNRVFLILLLAGLIMVMPAKAQDLLLVDAIIPEGYRHLVLGESVFVETQIILVGNNQSSPLVDVLIEYAVKDKDGQVITKISETKGGIVRIQTVKELHLPADLSPGIFSVTVRASYKEKAMETATTFEVAEQHALPVSFYTQDVNNLFIIILVAIVSLFLFSAHQFWKIKHLYKRTKKRR
ncbi:MAG: hypothetical protein Q7S55_03770 [Nanoarchaeota archaeon]|nr:hypothetical protein [Nanoarchaeota archaeon]